MKCSDNIEKLAGALAKAQGVYLPLAKDREVIVNGTTKDGKPFTYKFKYATLDAVFDATRKALSDNGLCVVQPPTNSEHGILVTTRLIHESGQWIEEEFEFSTAAVKPQDLGGLISYAKRYSLSGLLGITADEDDDANGASGNQREFAPAPGKARKPNGKPAKGDSERAAMNAPVAFDSDGKPLPSPDYLKAQRFIQVTQGTDHWQACREMLTRGIESKRITNLEGAELAALIGQLEREDDTVKSPSVEIERRLALCTTSDQLEDVTAEIDELIKEAPERERLLKVVDARLLVIEGQQTAGAT